MSSFKRPIDQVHQLLFATMVCLSECVAESGPGSRVTLSEAARLLGLAQQQLKRLDGPADSERRS